MKKTKKNASRSPLKDKDILRLLDTAVDEGTFPDLVNFDWRYGAARMHGYSDRVNWMIVIEEFTYALNGPVDDFALVLRRFGTGLAQDAEPVFLYPIEKGPCGVLCYKKEGESRSYHSQRLDPKATDVLIRGKVFPVDQNPAPYKNLGIKLHYSPEILKVEFQRWLAETYKTEMFATPEELGVRLPKVLQLEEWLHPAILDDEKPSDNPCFQHIAKILASEDPGAFIISKSNTHWSQRPEG